MSNTNPYMNQNMPANMRGVNMRGGCSCGITPVTQRTASADCGCTGNTAPAMSGSYMQRSTPADCGCGTSAYQSLAEIPSGSRTGLLAYIDQLSFAAYEAALYLDTHPDCQNGLQYFRDHNEKRNLALKEYARLYGPLTQMQAGESCEAYWQWANQPWPWEGGNC